MVPANGVEPLTIPLSTGYSTIELRWSKSRGGSRTHRERLMRPLASPDAPCREIVHQSVRGARSRWVPSGGLLWQIKSKQDLLPSLPPHWRDTVLPTSAGGEPPHYTSSPPCIHRASSCCSSTTKSVNWSKEGSCEGFYLVGVLFP